MSLGINFFWFISHTWNWLKQTSTKVFRQEQKTEELITVKKFFKKSEPIDKETETLPKKKSGKTVMPFYLRNHISTNGNQNSRLRVKNIKYSLKMDFRPKYPTRPQRFCRDEQRMKWISCVSFCHISRKKEIISQKTQVGNPLNLKQISYFGRTDHFPNKFFCKCKKMRTLKITIRGIIQRPKVTPFFNPVNKCNNRTLEIIHLSCYSSQTVVLKTLYFPTNLREFKFTGTSNDPGLFDASKDINDPLTCLPKLKHLESIKLDICAWWGYLWIMLNTNINKNQILNLDLRQNLLTEKISTALLILNQFPCL